LEPLH